MNLQDLFDGLSARMQRERSKTQMTLGGMISALEAMPADTEVYGLYSPHSYRGYYSDLAFESKTEKVSAGNLLAECKTAMGKVFEGYKGGDYVMGALTPVWIANHGVCGLKIIAINSDGTVETAEDVF